MVECDLAKVEVAGSNPVSRSIFSSPGLPPVAIRSGAPFTTRLRSAYEPDASDAPVCLSYDAAMAWAILVTAALFEVGWAIGLKYTEGFTRLWPSVWTVVALIASVGLLAIAARTLPIGTAYAVWTGLGAAGTALLGLWLFNEPATPARLVCLGLILAGVVGLKVVSPAGQ